MITTGSLGYVHALCVLCQGSNLSHWLSLHLPLWVLFRQLSFLVFHRRCCLYKSLVQYLLYFSIFYRSRGVTARIFHLHLRSCFCFLVTVHCIQNLAYLYVWFCCSELTVTDSFLFTFLVIFADICCCSKTKVWRGNIISSVWSLGWGACATPWHWCGGGGCGSSNAWTLALVSWLLTVGFLDPHSQREEIIVSVKRYSCVFNYSCHCKVFFYCVN